MKYDKLIEELKEEAYLCAVNGYGLHRLLSRAADAIKELQSTVVIVEVKENKDE